METYTFAVVGGGIAGISCAETLSALCPDERVLLVTASDLVKAVTNYQKLSRTLETFDVEEKPSSSVEADCPNVQVHKSTVTSLDAVRHELRCADGRTVQYDKLCICSGGKPKVISNGNKHVIGIRDTESVKVFQQRLTAARRIVVVGNGGIATELVYEIEGCEVVWAIKDKSIASTFIDAGAAEFFLPQLNQDKPDSSGPVKRLKYMPEGHTVSKKTSDDRPHGGALGPDWASSRKMAGAGQVCHSIHVEYNVEVHHVLDGTEMTTYGYSASEPFKAPQSHVSDSWPVYVRLSNGKVYGCDFIVSATGVVPNTQPFVGDNLLSVSPDGGIEVNSCMETSATDVYAAGDVCTASWEHSKHWLQVRLWSQARQMGCFAAQSMAAAVRGEKITPDFCFELFAHVTKFFNYKVVLLGKFNAQGLDAGHELLLRVTEGKEYVKVIIQDGCMKGAILIGETDLEETFENLILNGMDLTPFKEHLLDPNIDIDDFFD
ncbi:pyridine nucleotide-disulfide oxidoreductase domain-containing protein 1-like isoform X2 [Haliotis rufescens]|uniref:pyridine nucleotide-disulfide oxidoreductase domain-containing protein 1-like isoform X1 n=1 Tax=Haliotis rufescens TaxID=6454 RepID=UPI001EAFE05C|nr:pyridine nucleotide-disulfide oxidoreductase domain-containing protein 1-like isoform X1 [Haliotis rufescens]XP_048240125.1 pyridine nucleotide-disulfide oxidoreductase domain-containing protein 1-like isoform X2 [Haliotis rufescens]